MSFALPNCTARTGKRENTVNKKQKWIKTATLILAIFFTLLTLLSFGALCYSYQEMRHEGLTYSQWYEGSIEGFYSCQLFTVLIVSLTAVTWIVFFRKPEQRLSPEKRRLLKTTFFSLIPVAFALVVLTLISRKEMKAAQNAYAEGLPTYIKAYGQYRVAALLSCEALAASAFAQSKR